MRERTYSVYLLKSRLPQYISCLSWCCGKFLNESNLMKEEFILDYSSRVYDSRSESWRQVSDHIVSSFGSRADQYCCSADLLFLFQSRISARELYQPCLQWIVPLQLTNLDNPLQAWLEFFFFTLIVIVSLIKLTIPTFILT